MVLAWKMLSMLLTGDKVLGVIDEFIDVTTQYHRECLRVFPLKILKVKMHLAHHIGMCIRRSQKPLNCFGNERRNRLMNQVVRHYKKDDCAGRAIARLFIDFDKKLAQSRLDNHQLVSKRFDLTSRLRSQF